MIDWLTVVVPLSCAGDLRLGRVASFTSDGLIEWQSEKRLPVVGSFDSRIFVRRGDSDTLGILQRGALSRGERLFARAAAVSGRFLEISGCPAKFLQGHNVFGSDDVCGLVAALVRGVCDALSLVPSPFEMQSIEKGAFLLRRVDLTYSYALPSRSDVLGWIEAAELFGRLENRGRGSFPVKGRGLVDRSTLNFGQGSQYWWLKFYAKGVELEKHRLPEALPMRSDLLQYAQPLLRVEVQLNSKRLSNLGLRYGSAWNNSTPLSTWELHVKRVSISGDMGKSDSLADSLPGKLRPVYMAWLSGVDMADAYPRRTFYRHRKALLSYGVDIAIRQAHVPKSNVVPLRRVLEAVPVVDPPVWAIGTALYFDPSAEKRAKS